MTKTTQPPLAQRVYIAQLVGGQQLSQQSGSIWQWNRFENDWLRLIAVFSLVEIWLLCCKIHHTKSSFGQKIKKSSTYVKFNLGVFFLKHIQCNKLRIVVITVMILWDCSNSFPIKYISRIYLYSVIRWITQSASSALQCRLHYTVILSLCQKSSFGLSLLLTLPCLLLCYWYFQV